MRTSRGKWVGRGGRRAFGGQTGEGQGAESTGGLAEELAAGDEVLHVVVPGVV